MGLFAKAKNLFKKRLSRSYNMGFYSRSYNLSKLYFFIFRDPHGIDIAARSALRLRKFKSASKYYSYATSRNWVLRDHISNHFNSEIELGEISSAFRLGVINNTKLSTDLEIKLINKLNKLSDEERYQNIREMKKFGELPDKIKSLFPENKIIKSQYSINESYTHANKDTAENYSTEINNLKQSSSFIIGEHIVNSYKKPSKVFLLPFSLPYLCFNLIRGRTFHTNEYDSSMELRDISSKKRNCIVFFPTNGVGFGHFTRLLALARKISALDSNLEIVFITTMPTLHILVDDGFLTYHLPPRYRYKNMEPRVWNSLIEENPNSVFSLHSPHTFIFDGSYPYRGMLNSLRKRNDMVKIWSRRGAFKKKIKSIPSDSINHFDAVIRPGDSVPIESIEEAEHGASIIRCNPITLVSESEMAHKGELRSRLGIPAEAIVCYVQLGAGKINDISTELSDTLEALSRHSHIYTVIGESILGSRVSYEGSRVRVLRDYPNARYFLDFDFAVLAGGYNSYHEAIQMALPTICYPNLLTGTDDQLARCMVAQKAGAMMVLEKRNPQLIQAAINRISDNGIREQMKLKLELLQRPNGADQIAEWFSNNVINN